MWLIVLMVIMKREIQNKWLPTNIESYKSSEIKYWVERKRALTFNGIDLNGMLVNGSRKSSANFVYCVDKFWSSVEDSYHAMTLASILGSLTVQSNQNINQRKLREIQILIVIVMRMK